jgi:hypothetical protein
MVGTTKIKAINLLSSIFKLPPAIELKPNNNTTHAKFFTIQNLQTVKHKHNPRKKPQTSM